MSTTLRPGNYTKAKRQQKNKPVKKKVVAPGRPTSAGTATPPVPARRDVTPRPSAIYLPSKKSPLPRPPAPIYDHWSTFPRDPRTGAPYGGGYYDPRTGNYRPGQGPGNYRSPMPDYGSGRGRRFPGPTMPPNRPRRGPRTDDPMYPGGPKRQPMPDYGSGIDGRRKVPKTPGPYSPGSSYYNNTGITGKRRLPKP